jgi:protein TonB
MTNQERKNRNIGLITSAGIHLVILLLLFFLIAWRAPDPPLPEFGIQLNFGLDNQGTGDIQPEVSPDVVENNEEKSAQEEVEETTTPEEVKPNEVKETAEQPVSKLESPVSVKEEKKKETKETKVEPVKEKPAETKPKETTPLAEYKKEEKKETKTDIKTDGGKSTTSQGDDSARVGDKGAPEGSLDANALYGKQGGSGGGGFALSGMSGWAWADQPKIPELPDNADGRIVFEIECDDNGDIIGITTVERGLSPKAEQILKEEIRKNSLIRTSGGKVPERSKGRVVFLLKTK